MRSVMIVGVEKGQITRGRLYVEPVELSEKGIEATVEEVMLGKKTNKFGIPVWNTTQVQYFFHFLVSGTPVEPGVL